MESSIEPGLYLVSTPIGNIKDITLRAIEVLRSVTVIASEDTRRTKTLLSAYDIHKRLLSYHDHNKIVRTPEIISNIESGKSVALVTDSGTPGIQDPGFYLVREAVKNGLNVTSIPGPSAFVSALVVSGFATDRFSFEGFLSRRSGKRLKRLKEISNYRGTLIFYESPHRILPFLRDLKQVLPHRKIAVIREITKRFEEIRRGTIEEMIEYFSATKPRGEFVVVMEAKSDRSRQI